MKHHLPLAMGLIVATTAVASPLAEVQKVKTLPAVVGKMKPMAQNKKSLSVKPLADATYRLNESFEKESMTDYTLPEGWSKIADDMNWIPYFTGRIGLASPDGYYSAFSNCWSIHDEAWLISPEFTVEQGDELSFQLYFDVRALYVWNSENIDEEDGLILNRVNAENLKTYVSANGGEWELVDDLWGTYGTMGYHEIIDDYEYPEFRPIHVDLSKYAGETVKLGFCHSYTDEKGGYGMYLDDVKVGAPSLQAGYDLPAGLLFMGLTPDMDCLYNYAFAPCYTPIAWMDNTYSWTADFAWSSSDIYGENEVTGTGDTFMVEYTPDFEADPAPMFSVYNFPTVTMTEEGKTPVSYMYADGYGAVLAGGAPSMALTAGGYLNFGVATFDPADELYTVNADFDTPAWGHNAMTQRWWTDHYLLGEAGPDDVVKIVANINMFPYIGTPLVVNGVRVYGLGRFDDAAEFKMEIVSLNDDFVPTTVMASAVLTGAEVSKNSQTDFPYDVVTFEFKFDEPIVVDYNMITRFSGFDSDLVEYYAPFQSAIPAAYNYGFAAQYIYAPSVADGEYENLMGIYVIDGGYGDALNSFAMVLDAEYPYLHGSESSFEAYTSGESKTFALQSWYDLADFTVECNTPDGKLPSWLTLEKGGRFNNAEATFTVIAPADDDPSSVEVTLSHNGVAYSVEVANKVQSAIEGVAAGDAEVVAVEVYDLSGRRITATPAEGVYVVKNTYADGTVNVEKVVK